MGDRWDGQAAGEKDSLPQTLNPGCRSSEQKLDFRTKLATLGFQIVVKNDPGVCQGRQEDRKEGREGGKRDRRKEGKKAGEKSGKRRKERKKDRKEVRKGEETERGKKYERV